VFIQKKIEMVPMINKTSNITILIMSSASNSNTIMASASSISVNEPSLFIPNVRCRYPLFNLNTSLCCLGKFRINLYLSSSSKARKKVYNVYVHFKEWNTTEDAILVREAILNGDNITVNYDKGKPWFWKVYNYNVTKPDYKPKSKPKTIARIFHNTPRSFGLGRIGKKAKSTMSTPGWKVKSTMSIPDDSNDDSDDDSNDYDYIQSYEYDSDDSRTSKQRALT